MYKYHLHSQNVGDLERTKYVHVSRAESLALNKSVGKSTQLKTPPPHNITIIKGGVQSTLSRAFVEYILKDKVYHKYIHLCFILRIHTTRIYKYV